MLGGALQRSQSFWAQLRCEGIGAVIERLRIDVNAHDLLQHIAHRLGISENTVKFHVSKVLHKLGVSSRGEATAMALKKRILTHR